MSCDGELCTFGVLVTYLNQFSIRNGVKIIRDKNVSPTPTSALIDYLSIDKKARGGTLNTYRLAVHVGAVQDGRELR